jgi:hypothetical protein
MIFRVVLFSPDLFCLGLQLRCLLAFISLEYALQVKQDALASDIPIDKASQATMQKKIPLLAVKAGAHDGRIPVTTHY